MDSSVYVVTSKLSPAPVNYRLRAAFGRSFTLIASEREESIFDTRWVPPSPLAESTRAFLFVVLDGDVLWDDGTSFSAGTAFAASAEVIEGRLGKRLAHYRASGATFRVIELQVPASALPIGPEARVYSANISRESLERATAFVQASEEEAAFAAQEVLRSLQRDGTLLHDLTSGQHLDVCWSSPVWHAVEAALRSGKFFHVTREELAEQGGTSVRTIHRGLRRIAAHIGFTWSGWRTFAHTYRMQFALVHLSNPRLSIRQVALCAGYTTSHALTHAFYQAGLPAPGKVREAILAAA
ncbi:MAG: hypothetical protein U0174_12900 [Polyangiaceae bacterium]